LKVKAAFNVIFIAFIFSGLANAEAPKPQCIVLANTLVAATSAQTTVERASWTVGGYAGQADVLIGDAIVELREQLLDKKCPSIFITEGPYSPDASRCPNLGGCVS
jgi:hypothetical protein